MLIADYALGCWGITMVARRPLHSLKLGHRAYTSSDLGLDSPKAPAMQMLLNAIELFGRGHWQVCSFKHGCNSVLLLSRTPGTCKVGLRAPGTYPTTHNGSQTQMPEQKRQGWN